MTCSDKHGNGCMALLTHDARMRMLAHCHPGLFAVLQASTHLKAALTHSHTALSGHPCVTKGRLQGSGVFGSKSATTICHHRMLHHMSAQQFARPTLF